MEKNNTSVQKKRKPRREKSPLELMGYTKRQIQVLNGNLTIDDIDGHTAKAMLRRADKINDTEHLPFIRKLVEDIDARTVAGRKERNHVRKRDLRKNKTYEWKQPASKDYTSEQIAVIRGEIPLEQVHNRRLISIHQKARMNGDVVLAETIYSLLMDRFMESKERRNIRRCNYRDPDHYSKKASSLNIEEIAFLEQEMPVEQFSEKHIEHIIDICHKNGDTVHENTARYLLKVKQNPDMILVTTDHEEALRMYEQMTGVRVRRPREWFE